MLEHNHTPIQDSNFETNKDTKFDPISPDFQFDEYKIGPEAISNEVVKLLKKNEVIPHSEILTHLIEQLDQLDFEVLANPHNAENFKLNTKHYLVLSIENTLLFAEKNRWGLCKNHDFIYLFNGTFWAQIDNETFQKFLGEAAEKMGVAKFSARFYQFREQLFKQFLSTAYLPSPEGDKDNVLINLKNGTFESINKFFDC